MMMIIFIHFTYEISACKFNIISTNFVDFFFERRQKAFAGFLLDEEKEKKQGKQTLYKLRG
jgi:hypothetical protein